MVLGLASTFGQAQGVGKTMKESAAFWKLIEARRVASDTEHARIDDELWSQFGDTKAIVFTDLAGFTRLSHRLGIEAFLTVIRASHVLFEPVIAEWSGSILKYEGDSLLIIFNDVPSALAAIDAMFCSADDYNATRATDHQVQLCVGVGYGRVLVIDDHDLFGVEVNLASRLGEDTAQPGEVLVTQAAVDQVHGTDLETRLTACSVTPDLTQSAWSFSPKRHLKR